MVLQKKWLIRLFLFSLVLGCSSTPAPKPSPQPLTDSSGAKDKGPSAQEWFVRGNQALDDKNWPSAIHSYNEAIRKDKQRWDAYLNRGIAEIQSGKFQAAIHSFEQSLNHGGEKQPEVYYNLGNVYQERGMYARSVMAYRTGLLYYDSPHIDSLINLGAAYLFLREYENATATYQYLQGLLPDDPRPLHGLAMVLHMTEKFAEAVAAYEEVHRLHPNFGPSYLAKASVLAKTKKYAEAVDALQTFLRVDPQHRYADRARAQMQDLKQRIRR